MTHVPHLRLTMAGDLGTSGEIFSMSLSLRPDISAWEEAINEAAQLAVLTNILIDSDADERFADIVADCVAYFGDSDTELQYWARLRRVKLAAINAAGHYSAAPLESAVDVRGFHSASPPGPHQVARKVTLETDGDLGRIKGGFYLPMPTLLNFTVETNLFTAASAGFVQGRTSQFISDLNNVPGLDGTAFKVVIASQGRHNKDGSVRQGPSLQDVKRVNVGRRADVIRRRANKLSEARIADSTVE